MASQHPNLRSKVAEADLSAKQFHFVKDGASANGAIACDSLGESAMGILQNDPISGEAAAVHHINDGQTCKVILAEAVTVEGSQLTTDASGQAILADTTGHAVLARALTTGAIGEIIECEPELNGLVP